MKLHQHPENLEHALLVIVPIVLCGIVLFIVASCEEAFPAEIDEEQAIVCLAGEARGESEEALTAHGEAFRNRFARYGKVTGVFGCRAKFTEPEYVWEKVRRAWRKSATSKLVNGATHWESTDFKSPAWAKNATVTAQFGKTKFYRGVK